MLKINDVDWDLPTMNKNPKFGFVTEYIEKKAISGKIIRIPKGKRFQAEFSYAYLTPEQLKALYKLRDSGVVKVVATIPTDPNSMTSCKAIIEINEVLSRYAYVNYEWVWTDIQVKLIGEGYYEYSIYAD